MSKDSDFLFTTFSVLAIIVGCLGLFGYRPLLLTNETKEIGIRKVLGSTEKATFLLLAKGYIKLIIIACSIASPVVWYFMGQWVNGFSYGITISPLVLAIAGLAVMLVALLTLSYQTVKAARTNPVDTLKCGYRT